MIYRIAFLYDVASSGLVHVMQSEEDVKAGKASTSIPAGSEGKDAVLEAAVASVFAQMDEDRKTTALKSLQVRLHHSTLHQLHRRAL